MVKIRMIGRRFGKLSVIAFYGERKGHYYWKCRCKCGAKTVCDGGHLRLGKIVSCGCHKDYLIGERSRTHGQTKTPEYKTWAAIIQRCTNPNDKAWSRYGGRGIQVCSRWFDFSNFLLDMGKRPRGTTIDRFPNNNGDYEPANCRWATPSQQQNNTRVNRMVKAFGETKTLAEWCRDSRCRVSYPTLLKRLQRNVSTVESAITKPV